MVRLSKNVGAGVTASVEGETFTEAFEQMAMIEDCYEDCPIEGYDGNFKHRVRDVVSKEDGKEYRYYEFYAPGVKARLSLGQYDQKDKKGFLFPKRTDGKDSDGKRKWLPNRGWEVWQPVNAVQSQPSQATKEGGKSSKKSKDAAETPF